MKGTRRKALTLVELVTAMAVASILMLAAGTLLVGGQRSFTQMFKAVHDPIQQDSRALTAAFKLIGRKSNRTNYTVYKIYGSTFSEALPLDGQTFATGQAVEFRYWDEPFYETAPGMDEMDVTDTGTYYALFYLENGKIYVDYGQVVNGIGGVHNGSRRTSNIDTRCLLAHNVRVTDDAAYFSHQVIGGAGSGCVSLNLTLENEDGKTVEVKTATLLRVTWPQ